MRKIDLVVIHCSDSTFGDVALIDQWHKARGWDRCGYHKVILNGRRSKSEYDPVLDGWVELGRHEDDIGAHVEGWNAHSIGVCLIGRDAFTIWQTLALVRLLKDLRVRYALPASAFKGHCDIPDVTKTCPNFNTQRLIHEIWG